MSALNENRTVLFDVDGTLSLRKDRNPFDWHKVNEDVPNQPIVDTLKALTGSGYQIIYISGRPEKSRRDTEEWLLTHCGVVGELFMRSDTDNRKDSVVKREIYEISIKPRYNVVMVFDDRNQVVRMWRDEVGLTCLQVADGNF
jgi:hypothetical protein